MDETDNRSSSSERSPSPPLRNHVEFGKDGDHGGFRGSEGAVDLSTLSFFQIARDPEREDLGGEGFRRLLAQFQRGSGRIIDMYFCQRDPAAAVITEKNEVFRVYPRLTDDTADLVQVLLRCDELLVRVTGYLPSKSLPARTAQSNCVHLVFGIIKSALSLLDSRRMFPSPGDSTAVAPSLMPKSLVILDLELARAERYYEDVVQRFARSRYLLGLLSMTTYVLPGIALGIYLILFSQRFVTRGDLLTATVSFVAGGYGAMVSVMLRMTSGRLRLNPSTGPVQLLALGAFRSVIGAVFGLFFYFLIQSGLAPIKVPTGGVQIYFFAVVAFVAGFSERLAQDTIKRTEEQLVGSSGSETMHVQGRAPESNASGEPTR